MQMEAASRTRTLAVTRVSTAGTGGVMDTTQWIIIIGGFFIVVLVPAVIAVRKRRK
jgi:hypothetical protein